MLVLLTHSLFVTIIEVKMRGIASEPRLSPNFFIVIDRLYATLGEKLIQWAAVEKRHRGRFFGIGSKQAEPQQLLLERLIVAYDLAAAFQYIHDRKYVDFGFWVILSEMLRVKCAFPLIATLTLYYVLS
jgi:hypothetical protein